MREIMDKKPSLTHGSCCLEHRPPPGQSASSTTTPGTFHHLLRVGAAVLVVGAALMLCASMAALYLWKVSDKNVSADGGPAAVIASSKYPRAKEKVEVYNVHYSMSINGEVREGSVEIDPDSNPERPRTGGSGAQEAVEIHDFQSGITAIRFFGGDKCYIKSQIKANLGARRQEEAPAFDLTDELMPVRFDEDFLVWVSEEQPLKDARFLSGKLLELCGDLPIYWLQPMYSKDGERKKRDTRRAKRQFAAEESEAAAEDGDPPGVAPGAGEEEEEAAAAAAAVEEEEEGAPSAAGSAYNPDNPYQRGGGVVGVGGGGGGGGGGAGQEAAMTFDAMLDHQGICCAECQRSYTHCQRVCEPLGGHWPWPYNYRGCQVACRVIMPCRWWVARILGVV